MTTKKTARRPAKKTARRAPKPLPIPSAAASLDKIAGVLGSLAVLTDVAAVETARKVNVRLAKDARGLWKTGDGSRVLVQNMADAHLFYALAKARRGEYPDSYSKKVEVGVLESEALRRLLKGV